MSLPKLEDLPDWFLEELVEDAELARPNGRLVTNRHAMLLVDGASFAFESKASKYTASPEVLSPGLDLEFHGLVIDSRFDVRNEKAYSVDMGHGVTIGLGYYALVSSLYGDVVWKGSGPLNPIVAQQDGIVVAIVMPVRPLEQEHRVVHTRAS